jgi:UDP-N-acetylmuramate dehydrogenase
MTKSLPLSPLKINEPLSRHTYFKVGGPADFFFEARTQTDLIHAIRVSIKHQWPYFILGGGSNILVGDAGFRGLVIKNRASSIRTLGPAVIEADSGALLNQLASYAIEAGLAGLEVFLSVPGTVGGAIYNNSHYRPEANEFIGNYLYQATLIDQSGKLKPVDRDYFRFDYDYSILQQTRETIVSASFALTAGNRQQLRQQAVSLVRRRNQRQPIGIACSGCTFRNPTSSQPASALIDQAGLKGFSLGKVRVSPIHAAFIENLGGATAQEVLQLIDHIRTTVKTKFGVTLELEIFLVGEF